MEFYTGLNIYHKEYGRGIIKNVVSKTKILDIYFPDYGGCHEFSINDENIFNSKKEYLERPIKIGETGYFHDETNTFAILGTVRDIEDNQYCLLDSTLKLPCFSRKPIKIEEVKVGDSGFFWDDEKKRVYQGVLSNIEYTSRLHRYAMFVLGTAHYFPFFSKYPPVPL